jgi:hypothetical protein
MISSTFLPSARNASAIAVARKRAADAEHRRMVGGHGDDYRTSTRRARDLGLEKVGDFARTFADQPDDDDVGLGRAHHHAEQHRFADARAGHDADALALADREQSIDRAHADIHRLEHPATVQRRLQLAGERPFARTADRAQPVDRLARAIDHTAEHRAADFGLARRADRPHRRIGKQGGGAAEIHQQGAARAEADHFGLDPMRAAPVPTAQTCRRGATARSPPSAARRYEDSRPETFGAGTKSPQPRLSR